ncbi:Cytochrome c oxidase subunit 4 [Rhodosporidiobolus nylandii]
MFRLAARSVLPRVAVPRAQPVRSFATSLRALSDHVEPTLQGPGGKTGEVPTDFEQATGLERFELLHKLKGEEAFSLEPLEVPRLGTLSDPIMVHDTILFPVGKDKPTRCPECGCAYKVDFQGVEHEHHH